VFARPVHDVCDRALPALLIGPGRAGHRCDWSRRTRAPAGRIG
jgi:hypothetical protein